MVQVHASVDMVPHSSSPRLGWLDCGGHTAMTDDNCWHTICVCMCGCWFIWMVNYQFACVWLTHLMTCKQKQFIVGLLHIMNDIALKQCPWRHAVPLHCSYIMPGILFTDITGLIAQPSQFHCFYDGSTAKWHQLCISHQWCGWWYWVVHFCWLHVYGIYWWYRCVQWWMAVYHTAHPIQHRACTTMAIREGTYTNSLRHSRSPWQTNPGVHSDLWWEAFGAEPTEALATVPFQLWCTMETARTCDLAGSVYMYNILGGKCIWSHEDHTF